MDPSEVFVTGENKSPCVIKNERVNGQLFDECMERAGYSRDDWVGLEVNDTLSNAAKVSVRQSHAACMKAVYGY